MDVTDEYMTAREVAEMVGVSVHAVHYHIRANNLPAIKRGPQWFIKRSDLDEYLKNYARESRKRSFVLNGA